MANLIRFILMIFIMGGSLLAGTTGKLAGRVVDQNTGEPLIGVNVFIEGTHLGAATDADGEYYILNITPGTYTVKASYVSYSTFTVENLLVRADLTTQYIFRMQSETLEAPTITVTAERELIQKDLTSTRRVTTSEEIINTPGMSSTSDIFKLRAGIVEDVFPQRVNLGEGSEMQLRDESLKNIHVRGGRGGEILFMVDGMPVNSPLYGGRDVLNLNVQEVEQVELLTGAFSAEYGQAQSGVVNITTKGGSDITTGGAEYRTDHLDLVGDSYNTDLLSFYVGGPIPITQKNIPIIGLKIPGEMYYFVSTNVNLSDTRLNNKRQREMLYDNLGITERQDNTQSLNLKMTWNMTPAFSITGSYNGAFLRWTDFDYLWINIPDNRIRRQRDTENFALRTTHILSSSTFYNLSFSYLTVDNDESLDPGKTIPDYWHFVRNDSTNQIEDAYSDLTPPRIDPATGFYSQGYQVNYINHSTKTFNAKLDFRSQLNKVNYLKVGFLAQYNDINFIDISDGGYFLSRYGEWKYRGKPYADPPTGPYPEYGRARWVFDAFPWEGGFYIEDKYERESLIFNAGVRMDWFYKGQTVMDKEYKQRWENATGLKADWKSLIYKFSPRFGISFPVFENTVLFFSYGHFNQLPEKHMYYRDPYTGSFTGNPGLDYEQTILFEFGFTHKLAEDLAIDIKTFQRDISKQVGQQQLLAAAGLPVNVYDNRGYARSRGIEIELDKRYSYFTSGHIAYTLQYATGYSSSSFSEYVESKSDIPNPIRERRLDWDKRHQLVANLTLQSPQGTHMNLFGLKLHDNWALTFLIRFASGQPYTPGTIDPIESLLAYNSKNLPWTLGVDIKLQQTFNLGGMQFDLFADIFNIINRTNSQAINIWTGKPFKYSDVIENTNQYFSWRQNILYQNPAGVADPLHMNMGIRVRF